MNRCGPDQVHSVEHAYRMCRSVVRARGKNAYVASLLMPADARRALYAVYAFARHVDDLVDEVPVGMSSQEISTALDLAEANLRSTCAGRPPAGFWPALSDTIGRHRLSAIYFHDLVAGMRQDVVPCDFEDFSALSHYFYRVAGTVGFLIGEILGQHDPEADAHIRSLGAAFQLTNVLRDIGEDYRRGRIYLPADERDRFGVEPSDFGQPFASVNLRRLIAFQAARARQLFEHGEHFIAYLESGAVSVHVGCGIYRAYLDQLERQGFDPLRRRPSLSFGARLWAAVSTWLQRSRVTRHVAGEFRSRPTTNLPGQ
jgi:phytoene synthase